jgi:Glycine/serine hydroxymethyltransferase
VNITVNKNAIPNDPESPFVTSGIRVGTPAVTTRGLVEADMVEIAALMGLIARDAEANKAEVAKRVAAIKGKYPLYE